MTLTPDEATRWGQDIFRQFNLIWEVLPPASGVVQIRGRTEDKAQIIDITLSPERTVQQINIVAPTKPEYTALVVYTLATITKATQKQADTFLAQLLRSLRPARWGMWQVELAAFHSGLIIFVIKPGAP